jgi:outer membrane protein
MKFKSTFSGNFLTASLFSILLIAASCGGGKEESKDEEKDKPAEAKEVPVKKAGDLKLGFIVMDSLNSKYKLIKLRDKEIRAEDSIVRSKLMLERNRIIAEENRLQKELPMMMVSDQEKAQKKYMQMTQRYQEMEQKLMGEMQDKQMKILGQLQTVLNEFLSKYAKENGYDFILKHNSEISLFYGNPDFDITQDVIDGLNAEYDKVNK